MSLANAVSKARGFAAEKGLSYGSSEHVASSESNLNTDFNYLKALGHDSDPRLAGRGYRRSRSRSRSPVRISRDGYRDNYNPYRDERRDDVRRGGSSYVRERSFSPGLRGRNYSPMTGRGYGGPGDRSPPDRRGGDDGQETIVIESSLVGLIIGRQGENLRRVENETQTRVQFMTGPESSGPQRHCKISGTRAARDNAKREINRIIAENGKEGSNKIAVLPASVGVKGAGSHAPALRAGEDATQIMVPNRTVGLIIGRGGETIRDLQERSQCHVNIVGEEKSINGLRPVNLIGTPEAARMAKDLIMEIVESDTKNLSNQSGGNRDGGRAQNNFGGDDKINDNITVPSDAVGMIIGKGSRFQMQQDFENKH